MTKAHWNEELTHVFVSQLDPDPFAKPWGSDTQVDRDIKDPASCAANELCERRRHVLVVDSAKRTTERPGVVVLDEVILDPGLLEPLLLKHLEKKSSLISMYLWLNQQYAFQAGPAYLRH